MEKKANKVTSFAEYARHRNVSRNAVTKAIQTGRLRACLAKRSGRRVIIDIDLADREWAANTQSTERTLADIDAANVAPLAVSRARYEAARAELAELDVKERRGELIPASEVTEKFVEVVTVAKGKLLGLPARVKQRLPHIAADDVRVIDDLVREALEDLAND